jgi:hypothetical protein
MKLKSLTPLFSAAVLALALASTGCSSVGGNPQAADKDRNFLGLVRIQPRSYAYTQPASLEIHTNDVIEKPNMSGDKVSLLFGLINLEDY